MLIRARPDLFQKEKVREPEDQTDFDFAQLVGSKVLGGFHGYRSD